MPEWTSAQKKAITSDSKEIICSAAAGSGKTAVMVERIVRMLREGAEPDAFLVVTFTNAAASEMKEKIRNRMAQEKSDPVIRNAMDQMDMMQISTIHSFCQQLLRNQFQMIGLDPNFQICDTSTENKLFHQAFLETCSDLQNEESFQLLKRRYETEKAEQMIQDLEPFLMSLPEPFQWMDEKIERIPRKADPDHPWFFSMRKMAEDHLYLAEVHLHRMYEMLDDSCALESYRQNWKADAELFHVKQSEIQSGIPAEKKTAFARLNTPRGLTPQEADWKDRYQELRKKFKDELSEADSLLMTDPEKDLEEWENVRESLRAVQRLMTGTENRFQELKKARAFVDFHDLEQYAVQILSDPRGREEAQSAWRYVFVDECQDISAVQNRIIDLLQNDENHLFMVGDVKQSIYRFRLADPILFLNRIRSCGEYPERGAECIYLQTNFRSRPEILDAANLVFRSVMRESAAEIDYSPQDELIPGRRTEGSCPVMIEKIDRNQQDISELEAAADFLRDEIEALVQTPYPEKNRNYQYRDCVILMPAVQTDGQMLADHLSKRNIPVFFDGSGDYYQLQEIQEIRNLLEWIDCPSQDLPLISVLQDIPFSFTDEELSQIRLKYPDRDVPFRDAFRRCAEEESELGEKCRRVQEKLRHWQQLSESLRVSELIWKLYDETGIYYVTAVETGGEIRQANLRMLAQQAEQAESRGILTLRQFLNYMREQQSFGDQQSATLLGDQDNLVRIMTIHKSKGLQFPVVFCAGMDKSAVGRDQSGICRHAELGLCVDYKDPEHRISRPTKAAEIFSWKRKREETAEKIRLLYVAMTRAQERLYMITCQDTNPVWSMPEGDARILSAKSYTDWWMPVFLQEEAREKLSTDYSQAAKPYEIRVFECNQQKPVEKQKDINNLKGWLDSIISAPVVDDLWKKPQEKETSFKRSVTALIRSARQELEEDTGEETAEQKRMPDALARKLSGTEMPEMPAFMKEQGKGGAAWKGTLTHRLLSLMDLDAMRNGESPESVIQREKERMIREHMASAAELAQIQDDRIAAFWRSEMGKRILHSEEVHREWNFNLLIRQHRDMILQGVIDCAFLEDGEWVILDYKTDRGKTPEEMAEEYRPQLMWYARSLSELTGQKVREASLYSLSMDCLIPVMRAE